MSAQITLLTRLFKKRFSRILAALYTRLLKNLFTRFLAVLFTMLLKNWFTGYLKTVYQVFGSDELNKRQFPVTAERPGQQFPFVELAFLLK